MKVQWKKIKDLGTEALRKEGMQPEDAEITLDVLLEAEAMGIHSHGLKNLNNYVQKIRCGTLNPRPELQVVYESKAAKVLDADDGMGMVAAVRGMETAIELAKKYGAGYCCVRNSCHFGAGGIYANLAARQGMFAMAMSNTDPNMAVPGGIGMTIGNNPFAYAYPRRNGETVFLDIALSATAALKINKAKMEGKQIPDTWLLDDKGNPTTEPGWYGKGGALQPVGLHKGYGLSVMVEVLTSVLSGGKICRDVPSWCFELDKKNRASHGFFAIDIEKLSGLEAFYDKTEELERYIKASRTRTADTSILMPGEMEWANYRKNSVFVEIPEDVEMELRKLISESEFEKCCVMEK